MTKVAALELAPGVRVNTIFPGAIDTPMLRGVPIVQEHGLDWLADQVPLKRVAEPDDVAMLALYLASDESAYCTGGGVCHRRWPDSLVLACAGSDAASIGAELAAAMRNGRTMDATSLPETYRSILTIRRFEERLLSLHQEGLIQGSMHLCSGQEAIPVGACRELRADDALTATYRGHGWAVARGLPLPDLFAEVMGRDSPLCGGRGGSAYLCGAEYGFLGENSIVGGGVPIAVGAGLAAQRDGAGAVSLVSIGDGALNQGAVSEALNFAAVFALPVIVVVENNIYSEMTPIKEMVAIDPLAQRAAGFGIPAVTVDGNDAAVVQAAVAEAVSRARSGGGPSLVEAMTERLVGHYTGDAQQYRPAGEVEDAKTREPLTRLRAAAEQQGLSGEFATVEAEVEASIEGAVQEAMTYARPDPAGAAVGVYVD